jgi:O-acetylhomoserine/O-acetylserine sulfhydrylase-like pyridoxal-dependent enzyme
MKRAIGSLNPKLAGFDASCFRRRLRHRATSPPTTSPAWAPAAWAEEGDEDTSRLALPNHAGTMNRLTDNPARAAPDTLAVHTAAGPQPVRRKLRSPVPDQRLCAARRASHSARRFGGEEEGYTYSRTGNPTVTSMEMRLAALEGTEAAMATSTGMSAILLMCFMGLLKAGDHVIYSQSMFGSTIKLIGSEFGKFGVQSTFVSQTDVAQWKAAVRPNTRLLFAETPTNPLTEVCDIRALADIAHEAGALLAVDNCFCTPALQRPSRCLAPTSSCIRAPSTWTARGA